MLLGSTVVLRTLIDCCGLDFQDPLQFEQTLCRAVLVHYEELLFPQVGTNSHHRVTRVSSGC